MGNSGRSRFYDSNFNTFWCNFITNILLVVLVVAFGLFILESADMKTNTVEMLNLTRKMRNSTTEMQKFIEGALPKTEMAELLIMAHDAAVYTHQFPRLTQRFYDWMDNLEQVQNETLFHQWTDLSEILSARVPIILFKLEMALDGLYNATELAYIIEQRFAG